MRFPNPPRNFITELSNPYFRPVYLRQHCEFRLTIAAMPRLEEIPCIPAIPASNGPNFHTIPKVLCRASSIFLFPCWIPQRLFEAIDFPPFPRPVLPSKLSFCPARPQSPCPREFPPPLGLPPNPCAIFPVNLSGIQLCGNIHHSLGHSLKLTS
jgi:hypothetical protein